MVNITLIKFRENGHLYGLVLKTDPLLEHQWLQISDIIGASKMIREGYSGEMCEQRPSIVKCPFHSNLIYN